MRAALLIAMACAYERKRQQKDSPVTPMKRDLHEEYWQGLLDKHEPVSFSQHRMFSSSFTSGHAVLFLAVNFSVFPSVLAAIPFQYPPNPFPPSSSPVDACKLLGIRRSP